MSGAGVEGLPAGMFGVRGTSRGIVAGHDGS